MGRQEEMKEGELTENKRYQLTYKLLDKLLQGLTREDTDLNRGKDSVFSNHQVSFFDENGELISKYKTRARPPVEKRIPRRSGFLNSA